MRRFQKLNRVANALMGLHLPVKQGVQVRVLAVDASRLWCKGSILQTVSSNFVATMAP